MVTTEQAPVINRLKGMQGVEGGEDMTAGSDLF